MSTGKPTNAVRQILDMNAFDLSTAKPEGAAARRLSNLGALSVLFYQDPIVMASASGAWMVAADGKRYLDFYNNVPSVGHCHPRIVEAVSKQMAQLNTNMRYIVPIVDTYIEALKAKLPSSLANIVFTCSGSEANDLALRIAFSATGGTGIIVTETAYHGNTATVTHASPSALKCLNLPSHVVTIPAPSRALYGDDIPGGVLGSIKTAIAELNKRGHKPACFIVDSIFSSDGIFADPAGFLKPVVAEVHAAGALVIADEVQPGFARTGDSFWGFERHGIVPDIVTSGKPMGNGFPMAFMAAKPSYLETFSASMGYFNTFGGNPVAAAAGLAVLDVIKDENLQENALNIGAMLRTGLGEIAKEDERIAEVRGAGLFIGLDLCARGNDNRADPLLTAKIINNMRERGVLIGAAGKYGATLKLRPPLCLTNAEASLFLDQFRSALAAV